MTDCYHGYFITGKWFCGYGFACQGQGVPCSFYQKGVKCAFGIHFIGEIDCCYCKSKCLQTEKCMEAAVKQDDGAGND
jgi:hypothetical protein